MARTFAAASTDRITFSIGTGVPFAWGNNRSFAVLCRPTSFAAIRCPISFGAALATGYHMTFTTAGKVNMFSNNVASLAPTVYTVDKWYLVICTKDTGSVAPRAHVYDYAADTWVHENGSTALGNSTSPATRNALGVNGAVSQPFEGHIAAAANWNALLSDAQCEDLPYDFMSWWAPAGTAALMWILDQDDVAQNVPDLRGLGANQSAITGTTVSTLSVPVSYGHPMTYAA